MSPTVNVGQANKSTLLKEALNPSNLVKYNHVLAKHQGIPVLFFLPQHTPSGKLAKPATKETGKRSIKFLEDWLISSALKRNPDLINLKKTTFLQKFHVTGLFNASKGEATSASTALYKTLGLKKK